MGIKLKELIQSQKMDLANLKGKKIAIDGMNMLFQLIKNPYAEKNQIEYYDSTQRPISHLYGWLQKIKAFHKYKLDVVVVFDGKPDDLKRTITKDYARDFMAMEKKYKTALAAGNKAEARHWASSNSYRWQNIINESKQILEASGIPVITAPSEAEAQCAVLQRDGIVDYMISWDYDAILFGATKIIRSLTFAGRRQINGQWQNYTPQTSIIDVPNELTRLGLNRYQLIDLGILVGTDFFTGIPNIGLKRAYEAIKYYNTIEPMIAAHPQLFTSLSSVKLSKLRSLFLTPDVRKITTFPSKPQPNPSIISHLLLEEHHLSRDKVEKYVNLTEKKSRSFNKQIGSFHDGFIPANQK